ncbi:MAG: threonyl-tRNA synthetase editing domain-containing protein [Desulfuromonadales bacterium]|nr:threonyl-tRNA synthetase editing domain-containing protein [Desulfuromonadales bacterium]
MKLLMLYTDRFHYRSAVKTLDHVPYCSEEQVVEDVVVGLIHAEEADEGNPAGTQKKLIKNLKWGARKNDTRRIVLHSFSHLAETRADSDFTQELLNRSAGRLENAGYDVWQTPFGYFLDLDLQAPGRSTARIFTSF